MCELRDLIGQETSLDAVSIALREYVEGVDAAEVGAHHVTCSDESEIECVEAFQREFVKPLLPDLGPEKKSAFTTSNLGARYEWGSAPIAEQHFATRQSSAGAKCVVIKINGHVAVSEGPGGPRYGPMKRYDTHSQACGALHALLDGADLPFAMDLREAFQSDDIDRIDILLDGSQVEAPYRYLFAAICSARLQAARAMRDVQAHLPKSPTVYVIAPCVTLNRSGPDGELLLGCYVADYRVDGAGMDYWGLCDDPGRYLVDYDDGRLIIAER
jgi:hypothetical protein